MQRAKGGEPLENFGSSSGRLADRYLKQIRLLVDSMAEIKRGRYDYRIAEQRTDEFGQVYRAFDEMAEALQRRTEPEQPSQAP